MKTPTKAKNRKGAKKAKNACFKLYAENIVMLRKLARQETRAEGRKVSKNEVIRTAIEQLHDRRFNIHNNEFQHPKD